MEFKLINKNLKLFLLMETNTDLIELILQKVPTFEMAMLDNTIWFNPKTGINDGTKFLIKNKVYQSKNDSLVKENKCAINSVQRDALNLLVHAHLLFMKLDDRHWGVA